MANERLIERSFGFSAQSVMVSWLPMFHDMGLIGGFLAPLFVGFPSVLMAPNLLLREPVKWLQAVTEFRATTTGAPNFAYDLCVKKITTEQKAALDLSTLQVAYNGAEPVRAETLRSFGRAFRDCGFNESAFFPCYGMAETTLLVSGGPPLADTPVLRLHSEALENHRILEISNGSKGQDCVGCGQIRAELQVRIVHPETGKECAADEVGEIWVHGKSVAQGYFKLSDETAEIFQARIAGDNRNWLRTGDYGFVIKNELFVTGRLKDLIIVRGRNIYPQDIERRAEQHLRFVGPNAAAAFSVETDETVRLVLVAEGTREMVRWSRNASKDDAELTELNLSIDAFRQALAEQLEVVLDDIIFVRPTTFPRTSSGKVQRGLTKKWLQEGKLETLADYAPPKRSVSTERADNALAWLREFTERRLNSYVADERRTLPPHVILELGNKGLLGMQAPEPAGGLNLKTFDVMRVMEQLAAIDMSIASVVGVHNGLGLRAIIQNDVIVDEGFFDAKYVLGVPGDGFAVAQDAMMFCRLGIAAESIGIMKRCFQLMLRYSGRRNISTSRLLDNPVTINRMEDILLATGALESVVFGISKILDANEQVPIEAYAACKILGPELAWGAADRLVQSLGARGYTETNVAPRILRDTRLLRIFEGPTETLQMFLGSRVVQQSDPIYSWLISESGNGQIAGRLQNDVKEMMDAVGTTPVERQWMYQQVGQLAAWAIMLAFARARQRPSSFSLSDIESWIDGQYRHILNSVRSRRAYRCVTTTTPASLAGATSSALRSRC